MIFLNHGIATKVPWQGVYTSSDETERLFQPGDLVWAKVQGHPWYPSEVMPPDALALAPIDPASGSVKVRFLDEHDAKRRTW